MDTMRAVVLVTCIISLLCGVLDALKPNEKFDRQMGLLLSSVFLISILLPLGKGVAAFSPRWDMETSVSDTMSTAVDSQVLAQTKQNVETALTEYLWTQGGIQASVEAKMHITAEDCIEIEQVTVSCTAPESARQLLAAYLGEEVRLDVEETDRIVEKTAAE